MVDDSIDREVLAALCVMSKNKVDGVNYLEFVEQNITNGALTLIDQGYARKIPKGADDSNYCLTPEGIVYLEKIVQYANEIF